jgi:DNA-binding transcriptional regulator YhcF (GntR family)
MRTALVGAPGLSRVTVRRAIQTLVGQGALIHRQGKGTFVAAQKPHIVYEIDRFGPFMAAFASTGEKVAAKRLDFGLTTDEQAPTVSARRTKSLSTNIYETEGAPHASLRIVLPGHLGEPVSSVHSPSVFVARIHPPAGCEIILPPRLPAHRTPMPSPT